MSRICDSYLENCLMDALNRIRENQTICKLLYYNDSNPLSHDDIEDTTILSISTENHPKVIYTTPFTQPNVQEDKISILSVFINNTKFTDSLSYQDVYVGITLCTHIDLWDIDNGSRVLKIMSELDKIFNYTDAIEGVGSIVGGNKQLINWSPKFQGYHTTYKITNFS